MVRLSGSCGLAFVLGLMAWGCDERRSTSCDRVVPVVAVATTTGPGPHPSLSVYRQRNTQIERLQPGDIVRAGDLVQLSYATAGHRSAVVVSIDGTGHVTLHSPATPDDSTIANPTGEHVLDHAFRLDDACAFERFIFVSSHDLIDVRTVLQAAEQLHLASAPASTPLALPETWTQTSFILRKETK